MCTTRAVSYCPLDSSMEETFFAHLKLTLFGSFSGFILLWSSLMTQMIKNMPAMQETQVQSLGREDPLKKGTATHSSCLGIPWTEEPVRLHGVAKSKETTEWVSLFFQWILLMIWSVYFFTISSMWYTLKSTVMPRGKEEAFLFMRVTVSPTQ